MGGKHNTCKHRFFRYIPPKYQHCSILTTNSRSIDLTMLNESMPHWQRHAALDTVNTGTFKPNHPPSVALSLDQPPSYEEKDPLPPYKENDTTLPTEAPWNGKERAYWPTPDSASNGIKGNRKTPRTLPHLRRRARKR